MIRYFVVLFLLFLFKINVSFSQEKVFPIKSFFFKEKNNLENMSLYSFIKRNPVRAVLYSSIFPGFGQWYNKKKIKSTIIFGIVTLGIGITYFFENQYQNLRSSYSILLNSNNCEVYSHMFDLDKERLIKVQNFYKDKRNYLIGITVIFYSINIIDAFIDAHLLNFEIEKNLNFIPTVKFVNLYFSSVSNIKIEFNF